MATVTSLGKNIPYPQVPSSKLRGHQLARITGAEPVHARSNRALAAKFKRMVAESSGRMPDSL
jgi:hypothetical protein